MVYNSLSAKHSCDLSRVVVFCVHRIVRSVVLVDLLRFVDEIKSWIVDRHTLTQSLNLSFCLISV